MILRVRPEARADIFDAARWYEDREAGLGIAFVGEIDAIFRRIEHGPERFRTAHKHLRLALSRRFPYAIYFGLETDGVVILGVLHQRRDRSALDNRLNG